MDFVFDYGAHLVAQHEVVPFVMTNTHAHAQYELYFCPQEIFQNTVINGVEYSFQHPCAILSMPYTVHLMSCDENATDYDRYVFYFGEKTISAFGGSHIPKKIFSDGESLLFKLTKDEAQELKEIAQLLESSKTVSQRELIFALFVNKLEFLCPDDRIEKIVSPIFYIQNILQYISDNFEKELSTEKIAREFAVSRAKLERDFKKFTGNTVHDFIDVCRINKAKNLLGYNMDMSVEEIAYSCGFKNKNYFFPFFKKIVGKTPAEYRKAQNKAK